MIRNDLGHRTSHQHGQQSRPAQPQFQRERVPDTELAREEFQIEQKEFRVALKENAKGKFVRVQEFSHDRMNSVVVPVRGLREMIEVLQKLEAICLPGKTR